MTQTTAQLSPDGVYRYLLGRRWHDPMPGRLPVLDLWVMLNPSTADATQDDPTIRRCVSFSRSWGADGLRVVNLFALRATDPAELLTHPYPTGPRNAEFIRHASRATAALGGRIVVAWGAHKAALDRAREVHDLLRPAPLHCLGTTKAGAPRHPLYVRGDVALQEWKP